MQIKKITMLPFVLIGLHCFCQPNHKSNKQMKVVSFVTHLHLANATKDGIYLNGYVVNMDYAQVKKLDGKKIRVTGQVTIVKGLKNSPKQYSKNGEEIMQQGRSEDAKHILSPKIEVMDE